MMNCPHCGHEESKVIDSRGIGIGIRRRRECLKCAARFTTYERIQTKNFFVIKKDGRREEFNREKVLSGIRKACEKRPLPTGTIDKLIDDIEAELYQLGRTELSSKLIGDIVISKLKHLDHIAYIRFASVYRDFEDISDLKHEVDILLDAKSGAPLAGQLSLMSRDTLDTVSHRTRRVK
jgi:transcriptional repressor NrdR